MHLPLNSGAISQTPLPGVKSSPVTPPGGGMFTELGNGSDVVFTTSGALPASVLMASAAKANIIMPTTRPAAKTAIRLAMDPSYSRTMLRRAPPAAAVTTCISLEVGWVKGNEAR